MVTEKRCCHCKKTKPAEGFGKDSRVPSGLKSRCLDCQSEYNRNYHEKNRERLLAYSRQYHKDHSQEISERHKRNRERKPDFYRKISRRWNKNHRTERAAYMRRQRKEKPEYYRAVNRRSYWNNVEERRAQNKERYRVRAEEYRRKATRYRRSHPEKVRHWNRNRRVRIKGIEGTYTKGQWQRLCRFFHHQCPRCEKKVKVFSVDHIIPVSWEETNNWITNIQPLCRSCNSKKHDTHAVDYRPIEARIWAAEELSQ